MEHSNDIKEMVKNFADNLEKEWLDQSFNKEPNFMYGELKRIFSDKDLMALTLITYLKGVHGDLRPDEFYRVLHNTFHDVRKAEIELNSKK